MWITLWNMHINGGYLDLLVRFGTCLSQDLVKMTLSLDTDDAQSCAIKCIEKLP